MPVTHQKPGAALILRIRDARDDFGCSSLPSEMVRRWKSSRSFCDSSTTRTLEFSPVVAVLLFPTSGAHQEPRNILAAARPDWVRGQYSLGCAYEHLAEHDLARQHLANALRMDPSVLAAVEALYARMFWTEKKYTDAIAAADRALAANPNYYLALVIRGRACSALGRMLEAVDCSRRSLEIVPEPTLHSGMLFDITCLTETTP